MGQRFKLVYAMDYRRAADGAVVTSTATIEVDGILLIDENTEKPVLDAEGKKQYAVPSEFPVAWPGDLERSEAVRVLSADPIDGGE